MKYKHLFFDLDKTVAPSRQPILPEMFDLLSSLHQDIVIVSGQYVEKIKWQSNNLSAYRLGQNGNEAKDANDKVFWDTPLEQFERNEIMNHIQKLIAQLDFVPNPEWNPIEDRGGQITFSPIGNTAPVEIKIAYDKDRKKREALLKKVPFVSDNLMVLFGGSTSVDYIHKERHKGTNVQKFIDFMSWKKEDCVYFGDGLFPGGNDEFIIGVIDTIPVSDHLDCYSKLKALLAH